MKPQDVNPKNFEWQEIIYNSDDFSIARGIWKPDNTIRFAMRWNGKDEKGFPLSSGHPMWFQLPENIKGVLKALIEHSIEIKPVKK